MSSKHDREQSGSADGDDAVTRAWRQASDEQPPARLDAEILAAARQSIQEEDAGAKTLSVRPRARSRWMQWQPLAAAATVAGLAFVLLQTLPREREVAPPIRIEAPASGPATERAVTPPIAVDAPASPPAPAVTLESRSSAPARTVTEAPTSRDAGQAVRNRGAESAVRSPAAEVTADVADTMRDAQIDQRKSVMSEASGDAYSGQASAPAAARGVGALATPSTSEWVAHIEALHASGDLAGAAASLREFRAADPDADARLPESLREWARTVD
jgi:hypothetical protein